MISGIIYAIIDDGYFYIGSTTQSLEKRLILHISCSKNEKYKLNLYKYINEKKSSNWDDIIIIPLETIECETKQELEKKEYQYIKKHIKDPFCLNTIQSNTQKFAIIRSKIKK
jgi:Uri superfamily endonuclease